MRILYVDLDSQRPDHLGCYGYHRPTSPNVDRIAAAGVRYDNCYVSDAPCLPSRTSLFAGRFGIHTGVVNHGGIASDMIPEGRSRGFRSRHGEHNWMMRLRHAGHHTATISPFGERHSAWWWYAGFNKIINTGQTGMERADEVSPLAIEWVERHARKDHWFLHLNLWDPHTPYRTPQSFGNPFDETPPPSWLTEQVRAEHWSRPGPHSAQEVLEFQPEHEGVVHPHYPRQPMVMDSMERVRMMFDGYDTGVRYADEHLGRVLNALADQGVLDDTAIIISGDHGENLGELNIYGDHQTACHITSRVPLIVRWPGVTDGQAGRADPGLIYANDMAATVTELAGGSVPDSWDGESFAPALRQGEQAGRDYLVVSQNAWTCQRSVRLRHEGRDYICIRSYHDGYHAFPDVMLFDVGADPHQQHDLALARPEVVGQAMSMLDDWMGRMMRSAMHPVDPMWQVIHEGGPLHTRGRLPKYLKRLRETGRAEWADRLAAAHPDEC